MNFRGFYAIKYSMPKLKKLKLLKTVLCFTLCAAVLISAPIIAFFKIKSRGFGAKGDKMRVLTLWQIDGFEGGKGSRADFLQSLADGFSDAGGAYVNVVSVSASAARQNIAEGNVPDLISYSPTAFGLESVITGKTPYVSWCRGGYCLLTVDSAADFNDVSNENTVINAGKENLVSAAALFLGLQSAESLAPTSAYVKLINGGYKYLLGTQRDVQRLKTRGVSFKIKPVTEFNDLYQNISITATDADDRKAAESFISCLLNSGDLTKLRLFREGASLYDDELSEMENVTFEYSLKSPVSENALKEITESISNGDINTLKSLLK